jgi:1-acyl-sn-glycerol-3-phosphate acyltransferase
MTSAEAPAKLSPPSSLASVLWLNLFFWSAVPLVTFFFLLGAVPYVTLFLLIVRNRRKTKWLIRRSISNYGAAVLRCGWPLVRVQYVDHSPNDTPPFVFVSNHRSSSDAFLMACLPFECIQVLNNWPSRLPVVGPVSKIAEYLQVRKMTSEAFMKAGCRLLANGVSIITFPEGTRSGSRRLGPFHGSAFRLAQQAGANIVPLAISGNEMIPPRGSIILHPGRITVAKLPAVRREEYQGLNSYKLKNLVRDRIRQHLDSQPQRN